MLAENAICPRSSSACACCSSSGDPASAIGTSRSASSKAPAYRLARAAASARSTLRAGSTVNVIERELKRDLNVMRYSSADDFGLPETAFLICRFWLVDALWAIGRKEDARDMFIDALKLRNSYGLMSEDVHPVTNELWGNFPQTYSMAGIILSAIRLSKSWEDRYWRGSS